MMTSWRIITILLLLWIAIIITVHQCNLQVDFFTDHAFFILLCLIMIFSIKLIELLKKREIRRFTDEKNSEYQSYLKRLTSSNHLTNLSLIVLSLVFLFSLVFQVPETEDLFPAAYSGQVAKLFDYLYQYSSQLRATLVMLVGYIAFILIILILTWKATRVESFRNLIKGKATREIGGRYIFLVSLLWFVYLSWAALTRHNTFHSKAWDLAIFAQLIDNFKNGIFLECNVRGLSNIFSDHFTPIIYVFSPLLYIWNDPSRLLLIIQALFITLGAIPVYLLTSKKTGSRTASFAMTCAYLFLPTLQFINLADFHPVVLAIPILLSAWYAWECRKYLLMYIFVFLAMMCQEEIWVLIGSMGLFLALFERERKHGIILTILGWGGFIALVLWFFPYFRQGEEYFYLHRYSYLGSSGGEILRNLIFHPTLWLGKFFSSRVLMFAILMLLPVGFLPLLPPKYLLILLPTLFYSALSNEPLQTSIFAQYSASYIPFLMVSSVYGVVSLASRCEKSQNHPILKANSKEILQSASITVFIAALACNIFFSPFPYGYAYQETQLTKEFDYGAVKEAIKLVPENVKIAAGSKFAVHLIRKELRLFPDIGDADVVIFDLDDYHEPKTGEKIRDLLGQFGWSLEYHQDNVIVLKREQDNEFLIDSFRAEYLKLPPKEAFSVTFDHRLHISSAKPIKSKNKMRFGPIHFYEAFRDEHLMDIFNDTEPVYDILTAQFIKKPESKERFFGAIVWTYDNLDGLRLRKAPRFTIVNFGDNLIKFDEWSLDYISSISYPSDPTTKFGLWTCIFMRVLIPHIDFEEWFYPNSNPYDPIFLIIPYPEGYPNSLEEYFMEIYIKRRFAQELIKFSPLPEKWYRDKLTLSRPHVL